MRNISILVVQVVTNKLLGLSGSWKENNFEWKIGKLKNVWRLGMHNGNSGMVQNVTMFVCHVMPSRGNPLLKRLSVISLSPTR